MITSSILTNVAANTALLNLENTNTNLNNVQNEISTGLAVNSAADNASYYSIASLLRSDSSALSTVSDTLNLGDSSLSVASTALSQTQTTLSDINNQLVAASAPGADLSTIQQTISADQAELKNIAQSASFNGQNFLSVDSSASGYNPTKSFVASYSRDASGAISMGYISVDTANTTLFDSGSGVSASPGTGQTASVTTPTSGFTEAASGSANDGNGTGTATFDSSAGTLTFTSYSGDAANPYVAATGGGSATQEKSFTTAISVQNASASSSVTKTEGSSSVSAATLATNGDVAGQIATSSGHQASWSSANGGTLSFYVAESNGAASGSSTTYTYNKFSVTGVSSPGGILDKADTTTTGSYTDASGNTTTTTAGTGVSIFNMNISNLTDSAQDLATLNAYQNQVNAALTSVSGAASTLGTAQSRIEAQSSFVSSLQTSLNNGVGSLVDADLNVASTKLQALQVQQQLGVQSLSIANQSSQAILKLFQ
ncbi:MAG: flagellin [Rhodomicrobium sp.]